MATVQLNLHEGGDVEHTHDDTLPGEVEPIININHR